MDFITNGKSAETIANQINKITVNATKDPTATDDSSKNYFIGSKWLNTSTGKEYTCKSAAVGAAVWILNSPEFATQAEAEAGTNSTKSMSPLRVFQAIAKWISSTKIGSVGAFSNSTITANDTVVNSLGKLQGQINAQQAKIQSGTSAPTGGSDGDIYIQYFN